MKTLFTIVFLLFSFQYAFCQKEDSDKLKQLNHDWISSYVTRDTAVMGSIFADDLILTSPNGTVFYKKDILKNLMSPNQQYISAKVDAVSIRLLGNVGLVNARATVVAKANNQITTVQTCYLDVYEKRKGRWYAVASQVALLSEK